MSREPAAQHRPRATQGVRYLEATLGIPFRDGNKVTILHNGDEIFPAMIAAISAAREEINLVTFIYWQGRVAEQFAGLLADKASEGVQVRVLLDAFGAAKMEHRLVQQMQEAGVQVSWFRPLLRWRLWSSDNRTHRKVLVCDHTVGFTGGVGIAEEWEGDARDPSEWRDVHVRIEGPAVDGLNGAFWNDWLEAQGYREPASCPADPDLPEAGSTPILALRSTATPNGSDNSTLVSSLIHMAERRLFLATAYFVPDDCFLGLLSQACDRGVDVRIMMPGPHTDKRFDRWASEEKYATLLAHGARIFRFQPTMLHAKYFLIDHEFTMLGSTNFNERSLKKDNELSLVFHSAEVNQHMSDVWYADVERSIEVKNARWARRRVTQRVAEAVTRPFQRQL